MKLFEAQLSPKVLTYLNDEIINIPSFEIANQTLFETFGIKNFFENDQEFKLLRDTIIATYHTLEEQERSEYGDFQTNQELTNRVTSILVSKDFSPEIIIEPTCGKGSFIMTCLKNFISLKYIYGLEIYKPYVWETKFAIISFFLEHPKSNKPEISIIHCNVFDFEFNRLARRHANDNILIIGNPPWVTNSKLGSLNSSNLPRKTNFKNHIGLDAITGKGNFDIAEFITLLILNSFQHLNGYLMFLVKNSVIKNIVFDQIKSQYKISAIEKHCIDSKREFNVSVEASLLLCKLNSVSENFCEEYDIYEPNLYCRKFGWLGDKFVSNIDTYILTKEIDGKSPFIWRQGLKHDCSAIMELDKVDGRYKNGINENIELEEDLVYGILKSSDLKNAVILKTRKHTIVTQKKVGQDTKGIEFAYPKTYQYLKGHQSFFDSRKSSIYNNKPAFSIFGIGDYSFKPYKIAISGLYKTFYFTLVLPQAGKPIMLDDTCYLIGFNKIEFAIYALILLNSMKTVQFLKSITFSDAKRTFTKDILMRIDLLRLARDVQDFELQNELTNLNNKYKLNISLNLWEGFINEMELVDQGQIALFE